MTLQGDAEMSKGNVGQQSDSRIYDWLGAGVMRFVRWWRRLDAWLNQPLPAGRRLAWTWLAPDGHSWFVPLLAGILIVAMALGPTFETGCANLIFLGIGFGLLFALHVGAASRPWINQHLLAGHLTILALLVVLLIVFSRPEVYDAPAYIPRLHVGVIVIIAMIVALGLAWWVTRLLFRSDGDWIPAESLSKVELFLPKDRYDFMGQGPWTALASALFIAPVRYPVEILLPGSLITLFAPDHYLVYIFVVMGLVTLFLVFLAILFDRLMEILRTLGRLFFIGPQRVISILVIIVAVLRLNDVHYVTYLFNTGSTGFGNTTIMGYIALAYAAAWYYAFWCDIMVARRLMRLLDKNKSAVTPVALPYEFLGDDTLSTVSNSGREIALHGAGRIRVEGRYQASNRPGSATSRAIQFMSPRDVLAQFRAQLERLPAAEAPQGDALASLRNLLRSTIVYPVIVGTLAFGLIGAPTYFAFKYAVQPPELAVDIKDQPGKRLSMLLVESTESIGRCPALAENAPRIAVVASGGGTRAAIYTASLLRGLAERNWICNVVVVSGVSGGSAALAYFALHEDELRRADKMDIAAWDRYMDVMALPYIEYAIDGASDVRVTFGRGHWTMSACDEAPKPERGVTGWTPARTRLGSILAEAFVCEMGGATMKEPSFGIMLNTAIVGSFPDPNHPCDGGKELSLAERATHCRDFLDGAKAGGRLVLTNLTVPTLPPDDKMPNMQIVTINDPDVSVARAAALSANFPPVFPDAAIDVVSPYDEPRRFWVTDGGAVENRGAMTLYYAIRDAVLSMRGNKPVLPPLHIVVADVSASASRYSESFGFGSVLGAGGQLGLGLERELRSEIKSLYCGLDAPFAVHEIMMPDMFTNGGIGTHWLLPNSLSFTNPSDVSETEILGAADVKKLVVGLHSENRPDYGNDDNDALRRVSEWAHDRGNSKHDANWHKLLDALSSEQNARHSGCQSG